MVAANQKPVSQSIAIADETGNYRAKVTSDQALVVSPTGAGPGGVQQVEIVDSAGTPLTYNANGQAVMANSAPVTIASDQSPVQVVGNVASGATDSLGPVKIGGVYNGTLPTISLSGQRGDAQLDNRGNQRVLVVGGGASGADGVVNGSIVYAPNNGEQPAGLRLFAIAPWLYNGSGFDRQRMNTAANGGAALVENGPYSFGRVTADGQIKGSAGFIHTVTISPTGTVTAGVLTIYNSTTESGTVVTSFSLPVTTFTPFSVTLDVACSTGIYVGFDGTLANVGCTVSYR